jgi:heme exporter protein D
MESFLAMGGYAAYVWSAYGITALVLALLALVSVVGEHRARARLAAIEQRSPRRRRSA